MFMLFRSHLHQYVFLAQDCRGSNRYKVQCTVKWRFIACQTHYSYIRAYGSVLKSTCWNYILALLQTTSLSDLDRTPTWHYRCVQYVSWCWCVCSYRDYLCLFIYRKRVLIWWTVKLLMNGKSSHLLNLQGIAVSLISCCWQQGLSGSSVHNNWQLVPGVHCTHWNEGFY